MDKKTQIYNVGNFWKKKVYNHLADYLEKEKKVLEFGKSRKGTRYKHLLLKENANINFVTPEIFEGTKARINKHKLGDENRLLTNTASSQAYCFNLVVYLQQNATLANQLFSSLLKKTVNVVHLEPEFTPNICNVEGFKQIVKDESIGDQNINLGIGTDADIAVFYTYGNNKKGLLIIEFKFIEEEFSVCSSFRTKSENKKICNTKNYYKVLIENRKTDRKGRLLCGYNRYLNWELTGQSEIFEIDKIKLHNSCPFIKGLNQLWRNFLLVENVAKSRSCNEFAFWVFSPKENDKYLWKNGKIEKEFRDMLSEKGDVLFKKIYLEKIYEILDKVVETQNEKYWLNELKKKYQL